MGEVSSRSSQSGAYSLRKGGGERWELKHARAEIVEQNLNLNEIVFGDSLCMPGSPDSTDSRHPVAHTQRAPRPCHARWLGPC